MPAWGMVFDNEKYIELQSANITERIDKFGGKLYLEFGGKLFDDFHASRVLPGFHPDSKVNMLTKLKDRVEVVIAINADDIQKSRFRGDFNIPYEQELLRLVDAFREIDLYVGSVVITQFNSQPDAVAFENRLKNSNIKVYRHYTIPGYPYDISKVTSMEGCGRNDYIETDRQLVILTAPGPGSGKMAVCISQLYHDNLRGIKSGYAKFETFPVWNMPLKHPVNLAYEAATADLNDINMIDPFHLEAYSIPAVNYNRDVEIFPLLKKIFDEIHGECPYKSPTEMGVNMTGFCIIDEEQAKNSAKQEIIRRYYKALVSKRKGFDSDNEISKIELIMKQLNISEKDRPVISAALDKQEENHLPAAAMELLDGRIITGKTTSLLGASSALLLNAIKTLGNISDDIHLISPVVIEPIQKLKTKHLGNSNPRLHTDETLVALSISAATNPTAMLAMQQLKKLQGCEVHSSVILSQVDENIFRKLGINLTSEPKYQTKKLYHK